MKIIKLFILAVILLLGPKIISQEFKLGKVSIAELQQKVHPKDSSAAAAILYKRGKARIDYDQNTGFVTIMEVETRIKIYKKEGYDWANEEIWYYFSNDFKEKVSFSDAVTYNLVGGKIEPTKLKSDGVFDESVTKFKSKKKITMPNVKEGSVIEFKYVVRSPDVLIRDWDFQSSIPVNYSEFKTFVPEYFVFTPAQKGYVFPKVVSEKGNKSFIINSKERYSTGGFGGGVTQTEFYQDKIEYSEMQTTYTAENFAAMKDESYVNNIENYISSISHELSMTRFPNKPIKQLSTDWNSVVRTIYDYEDFGPELNKTGYFEEDLKKFLGGITNQNEKIWAILNYVKGNVKWNGYTGYSCDNGVKKAYKEKTGNIADINLMLTAMLRYSGLTANPVLVSTRSNGIALFPNRTAFNYVIAAVETPEGYILLDATDKYSTPNVLPFRTLNWFGRLIRKDGSSQEIDLMPHKTSNDIVFMNYDIDADGKIIGKARRQCTDYRAMLIRENFEKFKEEEYLEKLENNSRKIEVSEYSRTNEKQLLSPTVETYSFKGGDLSEMIGGKIYVNPLLFFAQEKNPFKQEVREYPVDFGYPFQDKFNITIKIPEGFAIETLPQSVAYNMENDLGSFKFNILANENVLQLMVINQINAAIISTEQYEMLKEYYKGVIAKQTEKIVLKRI